MDYPLQAQTVADEGVEVRVKTAPNTEVDVSTVSVIFSGGYTLEPIGDWDGTADDNGDYTFTISPDTEITSTFRPEARNTTVGRAARTVTESSSRSAATARTLPSPLTVEGEAEQPAEPTVEFPDHPDNAAERTIGDDFSATVAYTGATEGDEVRVIVNGNTQTHGEGNYEAPATVTETDGEFQISLPAEFLDEVHSGTADDQDVLQVRVGDTRNHIRITEVETDPTEDPTDNPTEDPTDDPTEDPTQDPTDDPTEDPTDDPTDNPTDDPTEDPTDDPSNDGDDEQSAPALTIEPDRISMSDFVDPDRGVTLTVTGLEPGDDVEFDIDPTSGQNVDPATLPAVATEDGVASTIVYGVSSADAASYIGDFDVTVDGIDDAEPLRPGPRPPMARPLPRPRTSSAPSRCSPMRTLTMNRTAAATTTRTAMTTVETAIAMTTTGVTAKPVRTTVPGTVRTPTTAAVTTPTATAARTSPAPVESSAVWLWAARCSRSVPQPSS